MEMYSWDTLGTFAGATAATLLIVQYLKLPLDRLAHISTRLLVMVVAFLILLASRAFGPSGLVLGDVPLLLLNGIMVALAAMGAYENTFARIDDPPDNPDNPA